MSSQSKKTKYQIIEELATQRKVEQFVSNTAKTNAPEIDDLAQDIYVYLLEYDDEKIEGMYERGELDFFIARMIVNQYISTSSPFYTKYKKFLNLSDEIKNNNIPDTTPEWMTLKKTQSPKD